jgi:hypothetical protein
MTHTNALNHPKETCPAKPNGTDDYTARMDQMLANLKKKSKTEHRRILKTNLTWIGLIILVMALAIYILSNISMKGEPLAFLAGRY